MLTNAKENKSKSEIRRKIWVFLNVQLGNGFVEDDAKFFADSLAVSW